MVVGALHRGLGIPAWATFVLTVAAMLGLAWLLHRFVERRFTPLLRDALSRTALDLKRG